jgi:nitroreductase
MSTQPINADNPMSFQETVRMRRSYRGFLPNPVPDAVIREVLEDAQRAPSNCNTQPWDVRIVSGAKLAELAKVLIEASRAEHFTPDFSFDMDDYYGEYQARKNEQGAAYMNAMEVAREDKPARADAVERNYAFFNAPHAALLFMPTFGDSVRVGGDIGMYGQTFLLSLASRGLGGIPQTSLGFFAGTIREFLGIPEELKMLFGISFGYPDGEAKGNRMRMDRVPVEQSVTFYS